MTYRKIKTKSRKPHVSLEALRMRRFKVNVEGNKASVLRHGNLVCTLWKREGETGEDWKITFLDVPATLENVLARMG